MILTGTGTGRPEPGPGPRAPAARARPAALRLGIIAVATYSKNKNCTMSGDGSARPGKKPRTEGTADTGVLVRYPVPSAEGVEEFRPADGHRVQDEQLLGAAALQCVDEAFAAKREQVDENFLVVEDVLPAAVCEKQLAQLIAVHRPQELVYEGNGEEGTSYTNSWRISTYAHTSPGTYVYQVFKQKYGTPFDLRAREYVQSSGLLALLYQLKSRFLTTLGRDIGWDEATTQTRIRSTFLSQLFLSVQPNKQEMTRLDSYLQPHYDPSVLTINLHLSSLDWKGCKPSENGLRVFAPHYPQGAKVRNANTPWRPCTLNLCPEISAPLSLRSLRARCVRSLVCRSGLPRRGQPSSSGKIPPPASLSSPHLRESSLDVDLSTNLTLEILCLKAERLTFKPWTRT